MLILFSVKYNINQLPENICDTLIYSNFLVGKDSFTILIYLAVYLLITLLLLKVLKQNIILYVLSFICVQYFHIELMHKPSILHILKHSLDQLSFTFRNSIYFASRQIRILYVAIFIIVYNVSRNRFSYIIFIRSLL